MSYLIVFCALSLIIILHELGHLVAAKRLGIPIVRFSVGFGPKLWGFKWRGTEYWLSLIPCGGYVLPGWEDEDADAKLPLKSSILFSLAGPVANILGAFFGLALLNAATLGLSFHSLLLIPLEQIGSLLLQICAIIPMLFTQPEHLSSIVGIVAAGGAQVGLSFVKLLQFFVVLNLNLAVFNLLPVLPLDGGKICMGVLRKIYPPFRRAELSLTVGGWLVLLGLTLYATALDFARVGQGLVG
jgi:regulator of sigma E protease